MKNILKNPCHKNKRPGIAGEVAECLSVIVVKKAPKGFGTLSRRFVVNAPMAATTIIHVRVDEQVKAKAAASLVAMRLTKQAARSQSGIIQSYSATSA